MPYYGRQQTGAANGGTFYSGIPPLLVPVTGYSLLATCPTGKAWEVKTVWMQNNHATLKFWMSLSRMPGGWIGSPADPLLRVFLNVELIPGKLVTFGETIGLRPGDSLWATQIESTGAPTAAAINMYIAGLETRV